MTELMAAAWWTGGNYIWWILVLVPAFILIARRFYITDASRMTSMAEARVEGASERVVIFKDVRRFETEVVVTYSVAEGNYKAVKLLKGAHASLYPPGRRLAVRYNPATPEMAEVVLDSH